MTATKIIFLAIVSLLIVACSASDKQTKNLSNPDNIPQEQFDIKAGSDTVISTKGGLLLMISKGTFDTDVKLQVREALTVGDMIKYGLTTTSNGKPLQTDGMFHIDAIDANGKQPKINIPIQASMPASAMLEEPQLFKGEKDKDGYINWVNPVNLKNTAQFKSIDLGESVFNSTCNSCHRIGRPSPDYDEHSHDDGYHEVSEESPVGLDNLNLIGPSLAFVHKRRTYDWFKRFTISATTVIKSGDACANCLYDKYSRSVMPDQAITDAEMEALWKYIIKESNKMNIDTNSLDYLDCDVEVLKYEQSEYRNDTFNWKKVKTDMPNRVVTMDESNFTPNELYAYSFDIADFGWYNIDQFIKEREGAKEAQVDVFVENITTYDSINVALVYKGSQTLIALKHLQDGHFGFLEKYYLPQEKIRLYALAIKDDKLYYDIQNATTSSDGIFKISGDLNLKPSTKEEIENELYDKFKSPPKPKTHLVKCGSVDIPAPAKP